MTTKTRTRNIPANYVKADGFSRVDLGIEVYFSATGLSAIGFCGRAIKADFHHRFGKTESAMKFAADWFEKKLARAAEEAKYKAESLAIAAATVVGDVFYSAWGYDQTQINYYEVTRVIGARTFEIRRIAEQSADDGGQSMTGVCVPHLGQYIGDAKRVRMDDFGRVKVDYGQWASKKEFTTMGGIKVFTPDRWSCYA